jgi:hypothetical protein
LIALRPLRFSSEMREVLGLNETFSGGRSASFTVGLQLHRGFF